MFILATLLALNSFSWQALAYPSLYNSEHNGCEIPDQAYGGHGAPQEDTEVSGTMVDESNMPVTEFEAGMAYTVTTDAYGAAPVNAWVHASAGTFSAAAGGMIADACNQAFFSSDDAESHTATWTAPDSGDACVTLSLAQAAGSSDYYHTNTVRLCPAGRTAAGTMDDSMDGAMGPMDDAMGPMDDAMSPMDDVMGPMGDADSPAMGPAADGPMDADAPADAPAGTPVATDGAAGLAMRAFAAISAVVVLCMV